MIKYSMIEVKDGNRILPSDNQKFKDIFNEIKYEVELHNSKIKKG